MTALRRRNSFVDVVVETLDGFRRHLTGRNSAVLTYYGFLTLFPLFLAATTILGLLLESKPEWRDELVGSAVESVPFIGDQIAGGQIGTSWLALAIGLAAALWGSMKAFVGLQVAYDDTWEIPLDDRAGFVAQRTRALIGLAVIGGAQVATVVLASLVAEADLPRIGQVLLVLGGLAINLAIVGPMYRFLTSADTSWSMVLPGAVFTGILYTVIQMFGTQVTSELAKSDKYGELGSVLALLSWLSLHAVINLFGAEINAARQRLAERSDTTPSSPILAEPPLADA
ncbi:MAG: YihY/virulence factor BrkB family protein [Ilumatobacteraceae bacterium]|nr:YihY/virulence factor BrkB family protein [Ilumatobacteraceae bacterium]